MNSILRLRLPEWAAALIIFGIGFMSLMFPQIFLRASLAEFRAVSELWTNLCLIVGTLRIAALLVNGHWPGGTPKLRFVGSVAGSIIFGCLAGNLLKTGIGDPQTIGWGIFTYFVLMTLEIFNSFFSASDVANIRKYGR